MSDNRVEVDEDLAAEQLVQLGFSDAVPVDEPLQCGDLVGGVMVDVHVRVVVPLLQKTVGQVDRELSFLGPGVAPQRSEAAVSATDAGEVLTALTALGIRVPLEVEIHIANVGRG